jgi:hypothetical protein
MGRKTTAAWLHAAALAGAWIVAAAVVQGGAGSEIGVSVDQLGERIELRLRDKGEKAPGTVPRAPPPARDRSREDTLQPWEHVSA